MKHDFTTKISREGQGSLKWLDMYHKKPDVSPEVVPLSVADMEFKHPAALIDGLKDYLDVVTLGYTTATPEFHKAVCSWMERRHGFKIEPEWIVNTAGVVPAFFTAVRKLVQPGEGVIIMTPVYYPFFNAIQLQDRKITDVPLLEKDGRYTMDYEGLEKAAADPQNKAILFCSPHNPVGRCWKREELEKLADIILRHDLLLLSDEIHFDLIMPGYEHTVFQTLSDELAERTVTFTAPSKSFNLAGMGMSNTIIKNEKLREAFRTGLRETSSGPMTALGYKSCELAYNECEDWFDELLSVIDTNQHLMHDFFADRLPQIKCPLIEGTYLSWVDCRALGMTPEELERFCEQEAELFLDQGYIFGEGGKGYVRFNLALPTEVLREHLERFEKALRKRG